MTKNIVDLNGRTIVEPKGPEIKPPAPQTYEIELKDGKVFTESGYLALGAYVALLERPNDAMSIKFAALPEQLNYVVKTDEVLDDES